MCRFPHLSFSFNVGNRFFCSFCYKMCKKCNFFSCELKHIFVIVLIFHHQVGLSLDETSSHIECLTFLNSNQSDRYRKRFADALISRAIEAAVILMWHGIWTLTDHLFHSLFLDKLRSAFLSLLIGVAGSAFLFFLQFPLVYWKTAVIAEGNGDVDNNWCLLITNMLFSYMGTYFCINR